MGRPYASEMSLLLETLEYAFREKVDLLCKAVETAAHLPLLAVGSGGSLTTGHFLAGLHQHYTGQVATVCTPFEVRQFVPKSRASAWTLSAGGNNKDILGAFAHLLEQELDQIVVLCGNRASKLFKSCIERPHVYSVAFNSPAGKDGFLATNSLLASCILLGRAYTRVFDSAELDTLDLEYSDQRVRDLTVDLWTRPTTTVLHGQGGRPAAIDLESKFTEAALGNLHFSDFRNFGHGRHVWQAKRADETGIIAISEPSSHSLATRTLKCLPSHIPIAHFALTSEGIVASSLQAIVLALRIVDCAGQARAIDPGRPGVPDFGRKLYGLVQRKSSVKVDRTEHIIRRKAPVLVSIKEIASLWDHWRSALATFKTNLHNAQVGSVVLDYDGTVVETHNRFENPSPPIVRELVRLLEGGMLIGIATGRGDSISVPLRDVIPRRFWEKVVVGYNNGSIIQSLDQQPPSAPLQPCQELQGALAIFRSSLELQIRAKTTVAHRQLSLRPRHLIPEGRLWFLANQVIMDARATELKVVRSTHSVDVLAPDVSKSSVVDYIQNLLGPEPARSIIKIGDRGCWPGNDYALLQGSLSLSVDEVSSCQKSCWNVAAPGKKNTDATLEYLQAIQFSAGSYHWSQLP